MTVVEKSPTDNAGWWANPTWAYNLTPDNKCATINASVIHQYDKYGFVIPSGSTIDQVLVRLNHCEDAGTLEVRVSWDGGVTWSAATVLLYKPPVQRCLFTDWDECDATGLTAWTPEKLDDAHFRVQVRYDLGGTCFAYGSKVRMADGSLRKIEDIKTGDEVLSWRPSKGKVKGKVIIINTHEHLVGWDIFKIQPKKGEPLRVSPNHDVAVTDEHTFKPSQNIEVGDCLLNEADTLVEVVNVEKVKVTKLINIQIDKRTLYVDGWLVHNAEKHPW